MLKLSKPAIALVASAIILMALANVGAAAEDAAPRPENLLLGKKPVATRGVAGEGRLADGLAVDEGSFWLTERAARLRDRQAYAIFDLGGPLPIRCAYVQGDNNDTYEIAGSVNGDNFFPMFVAPPASGPGMRTRTLKLVATARYVRLQARGGDGSYAVSELGLFSECPQPWPSELHRVTGSPIGESAKAKLTWFTIAGAVFILFFLGSSKMWVRLAAAALPVGIAGALVPELALLYPFFDHEVDLRGALAVLAGALAMREFLMLKAPRPHRATASVVLAALAVLALGCYYHFGARQFWHAKESRHTYVHSYDMRHYFPVAKYFGELGFDGLYAASFAAFLDLNNWPFERLGNLQFRDLRVSKMKPAHEMRSHVEEVRGRFSDARWASFKQDIRTFVDIMGDQAFLENMNDHGGNATPVWLLSAGAILHSMPATETNLILVGLFDPLLLAIMFFAIGRVFGWRVMGYVMVLFGATDFYQFGSNLMGSMLRQDWLVALALGACAFRRQRPLLAGVLFAYAGLVRAFPAMATFFMVVPALTWALEEIRRRKRLPTWAEFSAEHRPTIRAAVGAVACVAIFVGITMVAYGPRAWTSWAEKISIHNQDVSVNNVGLRNVMSYSPSETARKLTQSGHPDPWGRWQHNFFANLRSRAPIRYALMAGFVVLALMAACRRRPESAALIGLTTIPFLFYPSNYYMHLIFLLPLAVPRAEAPRRFGEWVVILCALCVGQWASYKWAKGWHDEFFTYQSLMLLAAFVLLVLPLAPQWKDAERDRAAKPRLATG